MNLRLRTSMTVPTVLVLVGTCLTAAPAYSARAGRPKANLVVTEIRIELPGTPHYITVGHTGLTPRFLIRVTTKNEGTATAARSRTGVTLEERGSSFTKAVRVPALAPKKEFTGYVTIDPYTPPLGIIKTVGQADLNHAGTKTNGPEIVIIPRRWDVTTFKTHTSAAGIQTSDTSADSDKSGTPFYFSFSKLDEAAKKFYYTAKGGITENWSEVGTCSGSGSRDESRSPWRQSYLWISAALTSYNASIDASHQASAFNVTVTCLGGGGTRQVSVKFQDLVTDTGKKGFPATSPTSPTLSGDGSTPNGPLMTTWTWDFSADVP